jgi:hypothetical protein
MSWGVIPTFLEDRRAAVRASPLTWSNGLMYGVRRCAGMPVYHVSLWSLPRCYSTPLGPLDDAPLGRLTWAFTNNRHAVGGGGPPMRLPIDTAALSSYTGGVWTVSRSPTPVPSARRGCSGPRIECAG